MHRLGHTPAAMTKPETSSLMRFWSLMMGCGAVRQAALMQGSSQSRDGTLDGMQEEAAFASDAPGDVQRVPPNAPRMKAGADADAETAPSMWSRHGGWKGRDLLAAPALATKEASCLGSNQRAAYTLHSTRENHLDPKVYRIKILKVRYRVLQRLYVD
jgi:hypothetical protein